MKRRKTIEVEEYYILMMKTGEFASLHDKNCLAYPVNCFQDATMTNNLDDLKKWISYHEDNENLVDIFYFNAELEKL